VYGRNSVTIARKFRYQQLGGPAGIRDTGLLESALYRPRTGHHIDLAAMPAALFESLVMNHPFVEANKRIAFFATDWQLNSERSNPEGLATASSI